MIYENHDLPAIFALSNKQYETYRWLLAHGAKEHYYLFENRAERHRDIEKIGYQWAREVLDAHYPWDTTVKAGNQRITKRTENVAMSIFAKEMQSK